MTNSIKYEKSILREEQFEFFSHLIPNPHRKGNSLISLILPDLEHELRDFFPKPAKSKYKFKLIIF